MPRWGIRLIKSALNITYNLFVNTNMLQGKCCIKYRIFFNFNQYNTLFRYVINYAYNFNMMNVVLCINSYFGTSKTFPLFFIDNMCLELDGMNNLTIISNLYWYPKTSIVRDLRHIMYIERKMGQDCSFYVLNP